MSCSVAKEQNDRIKDRIEIVDEVGHLAEGYCF